MKFRHISLSILMMAAFSQTASAQNIMVPEAYMFGFIASFNDSTVYFTDIQKVDSAWVTKKKKLLAGKSNYSYQLREFFTQQRSLPNRTCVVVGSINRKDVEKKYAKMKKKYITKDGKYDVRYLPESEFRFKSVDMDDGSQTVVEQPKKKKKKDKKQK